MNINIIRHSLAHILAYAVKELYPEVKFGIGPAIENGFYYDFDFAEVNTNRIGEEDLQKIEEKMRELIKKNIKFEKKIISKEEAKQIFKDQPYKLELIEEIQEKNVSIYQSGNFADLCKGPHIKSTKEIPVDAFKLTRIAGAYWKGDEKKPMLIRVYGIAFDNKNDLGSYLKKEEMAEKIDHRNLGKKLDLFLSDEEVGAGLPLWLPKGEILKEIIKNYLKTELLVKGYQFVGTPHIGKLELWKTSGHWELYRENIYSPIDIEGEKFLLKPMNCPFHVKIYQSKIRSYKDLPVRLAEFGTVYRFERSGTLHGLTRVRGFTQDDAHIWCTPDQLNTELTKLLKEGLKILKTFGFKDFNIYISTRPEKFAGNEKGWKKAENSLRYVLKKMKLKYEIDPGGGVFYGPKIDIKIKDNLGREWQCTTIQVDFNLPDRFNIFFINEKGKKEKPYMIHRALIGSLERFIGVLIEQYEGAFPLWLSPEQVWIIPVGSRHKKYANLINQQLTTNNLRTKVKDENETVSKKIREGEIQKIPYLLVVGDKEMQKNSVRIRKRGKGDIGMLKLNKFLEKIKTDLTQNK